MKTFVTLLILLFTTLSNMAQVQNGYIRTKGTKAKPKGQPIESVQVYINGLSDPKITSLDGNFSFKLKGGEKTFSVKNVLKHGYNLFSQLPPSYNVGPAKFEIIMESKKEKILQQDKLKREIGDSIATKLGKKIEDLEQRIKYLEQTRSNENSGNKKQIEELKTKLDKLYDKYVKKDSIVGAIVNEYLQIDYATMSQREVQFCTFIEKGEVERADSMLNSINISEILNNIKVINTLIADKQKDIDELKRAKKPKIDDACFVFHGKIQIAEQNCDDDSVAYYYQCLADVDTTNYKNVLECAKYFSNEMKHEGNDSQRKVYFEKSLKYYLIGIHQLELLYESDSISYTLPLAEALWNLGATIYNSHDKTHYLKDAKNYFLQALPLIVKMAAENPLFHSNLADLYFCLGWLSSYSIIFDTDITSNSSSTSESNEYYSLCIKILENIITKNNLEQSNSVQDEYFFCHYCDCYPPYEIGISEIPMGLCQTDAIENKERLFLFLNMAAQSMEFLEDWNNAEKYYLRAHKLGQELPNKERMYDYSKLLVKIIYFYDQRNDSINAKKYLEKLKKYTLTHYREIDNNDFYAMCLEYNGKYISKEDIFQAYFTICKGLWYDCNCIYDLDLLQSIKKKASGKMEGPIDVAYAFLRQSEKLINQKGSRDVSVIFAKQALKEAKQTDDTGSTAYIMSNLAYKLFFVKQYSEAEQYARKALEIDSTLVETKNYLISSLLSQGKYDVAKNVATFEKDKILEGSSLFMMPDNFDMRDYFYNNQQTENYYKLASENYEILAKQDPETFLDCLAATQYNLGSLYLENKDTVNCEKYYMLALENYKRWFKRGFEVFQSNPPYFTDYYNGLSQDQKFEYLYLYKKKLALEEAKLLNSTSRIISICDDLSYNMLNLKQYSEAELYARKALEFDSTQVLIKSYLIYSLLSQKKYEIAKNIAANERNVALGDTCKQLSLEIFNKSHSQLRNKRKYYEIALENYEMLAKQAPGTFLDCLAATQYNLGSLYFDKKDYINSDKYYKQALESYEQLFKENHDIYKIDLAKTYVNVMLLYTRKDSIEQYDKYLGKALELYTELYLSQPNVYINLVIELRNRSIARMLANRDVDEATKLAEETYAMDETNDKSKSYLTNCYNRKAYEYANASDFNKALITINKAITLIPTEANYYDSKGEILLMQGKNEEALAMWKKVLELNPNFLDNYPNGTELSNGLKKLGLIE